MSELLALAERISVCPDCNLCETRTKSVPGVGPEQVEVMFIGEAPGFNEDKQGEPFVGQAGQFLNDLVRAGGLERKDVFITNVVKCRPPNNRDPLPGEIEACRKYLERQIQLLDPSVIVTLGRYSLQHFLPGQTISRAHGKPVMRHGRTILPMYHPAAALHQGSLRAVIIEDFKKLPGILAEARRRTTERIAIPTAHAARGSAVGDGARPEPLSLFARPAGSPPPPESQSPSLQPAVQGTLF